MKTELPGQKKARPEKPILLFFIAVVFLLTAKSVYALSPLILSLQSLPLVLAICLPPIVLVLSLSFLFVPERALIFLLVVNVILSFLFLADVLYFRAFGHFPSIVVLLPPPSFGGLGGSILALVHWTDLLLFMDVPLLGLWALRLRKSSPKSYSLTSFVIPAMCCILLLVPYGIFLTNQKFLGNAQYAPSYLSPLGYHIYDIYEYLRARDQSLSAEDLASIRQWFDANQKYQEASPDYQDYAGLLKGRSIAVVQFESLESFLIGYKWGNEEITPTINRLLSESIYFPNILAQVGDGNSSDAELLFNASLYPLRKGSAFISQPDTVYPSLPYLFKNLGYQTIALHGDDKAYWSRGTVFPRMGYDSYISEEQFELQDPLGMGLSDKALFKELASVFAGSEDPVFAFAITLSSHLPFEAGVKADQAPLDGSGMDVDYLESIRYADDCLGDFLDAMGRINALDNMALIIYGDHEGIHKYGSSQFLPENDGYIPFLVYVPGMGGIQIQKNGGQIDMYPTIAFLAGMNQEDYGRNVMGRNLLGKFSGSAITWEGKILDGTDGSGHLQEGLRISDLMIRSNYYKENRD